MSEKERNDGWDELLPTKEESKSLSKRRRTYHYIRVQLRRVISKEIYIANMPDGDEKTEMRDIIRRINQLLCEIDVRNSRHQPAISLVVQINKLFQKL